MKEEEESIKEYIKNVKNLKEIGSGQFGVVYKLVYKGEEYAIKKISKKIIDYNPDKEYGEYLKKAVIREIEILGRMSQFENSVKLYYFFNDENDYILVLELCDTDLKKLLEHREKFNAPEILFIMEGLNKPLKYMHRNGLLHRDIKPENIMIKYTDSSKTKFIPKIADYGISRELDEGTASTILGSPRYMSPEIFQQDDIYTDKSDLFSIGIMIYEFYFKSFPFSLPKNRSKKEVQKNYDKKKQKDCEDKNLDDLLNKLLIYDPDKRISWEEYFDHPFFNSNRQIENLTNKLNNMKINDEKEHQIINFYDYVLEKMIYQNYNENKTINNISPDNLISIDECLKNEKFFILGILGKYLEQIGISVVIEKEFLPRNSELKDYHKNIFQFICNSYIYKYKYLLDFDLGENRIKYLFKNPIEICNFNENLKNIIMKIYNLKDEELLIANFVRDKNKFTIAIVIKSNYNINITKEELIKGFEEKDKELKSLTNIEKELICPKIKLNRSMLFPREDNKKNIWANNEKRGGEDYIPPLGWTKYGIKCDYDFNDKNQDWIRKQKKGEWCVAYCGISGITKKIEQIYENDDDIRHRGKKVGIGVYCPSDPKIMEDYTETININGENYKVGFMIRVKPDKFRASGNNKNIWIVNGNDNELRPYGILIKKI